MDAVIKLHFAENFELWVGQTKLPETENVLFHGSRICSLFPGSFVCPTQSSKFLAKFHFTTASITILVNYW